MFDDAALAREEIEPEEKTRNEVLEARVNLYMAAKKWDMVAAVASHLVKVDPETAGWWMSRRYLVSAFFTEIGLPSRALGEMRKCG
jgi:hypothetical protein